MSELSCGTRFIGRNETLDLSLSLMCGVILLHLIYKLIKTAIR